MQSPFTSSSTLAVVIFRYKVIFIPLASSIHKMRRLFLHAVSRAVTLTSSSTLAVISATKLFSLPSHPPYIKLLTSFLHAVCSHPLPPHLLRQSTSVTKLFSFPSHPPYINSTHCSSSMSYPHRGKRPSHGPTSMGCSQTSLFEETKNGKQANRKKQTNKQNFKALELCIKMCFLKYDFIR